MVPAFVLGLLLLLTRQSSIGSRCVQSCPVAAMRQFCTRSSGWEFTVSCSMSKFVSTVKVSTGRSGAAAAVAAASHYHTPCWESSVCGDAWHNFQADPRGLLNPMP